MGVGRKPLVLLELWSTPKTADLLGLLVGFSGGKTARIPSKMKHATKISLAVLCLARSSLSLFLAKPQTPPPPPRPRAMLCLARFSHSFRFFSLLFFGAANPTSGAVPNAARRARGPCRSPGTWPGTAAAALWTPPVSGAERPSRVAGFWLGFFLRTRSARPV